MTISISQNGGARVVMRLAATERAVTPRKAESAGSLLMDLLESVLERR